MRKFHFLLVPKESHSPIFLMIGFSIGVFIPKFGGVLAIYSIGMIGCQIGNEESYLFNILKHSWNDDKSKVMVIEQRHFWNELRMRSKYTEPKCLYS